MSDARVPTAHPLTRREMQVAERIARGLTTRQIAAELGITPGVVRMYVTRAAGKIPGDLPAQLRIRHWYLGGETVRVLRSD